jgi:hypothetical protein
VVVVVVVAAAAAAAAAVVNFEGEDETKWREYSTERVYAQVCVDRPG